MILTRWKKLFQRLLEEGFEASIALRIAELARSRYRKEVILEIMKIDNITQSTKNVIIVICNDIL